jgi:hypothetical protein
MLLGEGASEIDSMVDGLVPRPIGSLTDNQEGLNAG